MELTAVRVHRSRDRIVTGVAAGWADRWRVEPTVVRAALVLLSFAGGLGVVIYLAAAVVSQPTSDEPATPVARERRRELAVATGTGAVLVAARVVGLWPGDRVMVPLALATAGISLAWTMRPGEPAGGLSEGSRRALQVAGGAALVAVGVGSLASATGGLADVGASASAIAIVIGGLVLFGGPALGRLVGALDDERAQRIREDERAALAAHLHDSVLQTLVLIQRADDGRRAATLARREERQLRAWLYGGRDTTAPATVHAAVERLTSEIEDDHEIRVEAVVVGDQPLDEVGETLVAALREALVNAARHADAARVDVFVEIDEAELTAFVRDTGRGFDPSRVPAGRRGISDSIIGRMQRGGGRAVLSSGLGAGTEIELRIPQRRAGA